MIDSNDNVIFDTTQAKTTQNEFLPDLGEDIPAYSAYSSSGVVEVRCDGYLLLYKDHFLPCEILPFTYAFVRKKHACLIGDSPLLSFISQGDVVYVDFGQTTDFFVLRDKYNVSFEGKVVLSRLGRCNIRDKVSSVPCAIIHPGKTVGGVSGELVFHPV